MPETSTKPNKNAIFSHEQDNGPSPENITTFDHRVYVTARWLAARFGIDPQRMISVIDDIKHDAVIYCDGANIWLGDGAFIEIYQHPLVDHHFDETARMSILQLLGHYERKQGCPHLVQGGVPPLDCELVVCQCLATQ